MNHRDIAGVMTAAAPAFRDYVVRVVSPLVDRLLVVERFIRDFKVPKDGKDADPEVMAGMISAEVARLLPAAVEAAIAAKESTFVEIERTVADRVEKELSDRVAAGEGKVDWDDVERLVVGITDQKFAIREAAFDENVRPIVEQVVAAQVSAIAPAEPGKDGKDADPVDLDEVASRVAKLIPVPEPGKDGKDADPVAIKAAVLDIVAEVLPGEVSAAVEKIEKPKDGIDGKDAAPVDHAEVARLVVDLMPVPQNGKDGIDGKSVTVDDVRPLLQEMVTAIEPAKDGRDGKDSDPVEVAALIIHDVAKLVPVPADGKSVTIEDVAPLIDEAAAKRLPNALLVNEAGVLVAVYPSGDLKPVGKVRGDDGASLLDGKVDEDGALVLRMSDGRIIQTGRIKGEDGKHGESGQKGDPGRDAHEVQILSGVDEHKSYVEGSVANWRGGLIRAVRQTDPIVDGDIVAAGWKVQLQGIAEEREDYTEDGRYLERTTVYTDGSEFKRRHKTVTPIYQGTWKEDASYSKGDEITWSGSSFIATRDNQSEKPQITDAWKLKTKRGRDGKDGKIDRPPPVVKLDPDKR